MKKVNENKLKEYTMWNKRVLSGVQLDNQLKITFKGGESERTMRLLLKSDNLVTGGLHIASNLEHGFIFFRLFLSL